MVYKAAICLIILIEMRIQVIGLNIDRLHKEVFPYKTHSGDSKRQFVYGRVLNPPNKPIDVNHDSRLPFHMNTMFSSAMGNKLKRLVSDIDDKMKKGGTDDKTSDGSNVAIMKRGDKNDRHGERHIFRHDEKSNPSGDKRFVGLNEEGLQKISTRSENSDQIPDEKATANGPRTVWMDKDDNSYGLAGAEDQDSQQTRIFHQHNRAINNMKKSDETWFERHQATGESVNENDGQQTREMRKKDEEAADDFQFFSDDGEVIKQMKRVFDDDESKEDGTKEEENSKEQRKEEEKSMADAQHEELMDEYMKYIAQATSIKKRSLLPAQRRLRPFEMIDTEKISEGLKEVERIILEEANDIMRREGQLDPSEIENEVMNRVRAANDLEHIRNSILDLEDTMYEMRDEDMPTNDVFVPEKRGNKLANALNIMAPTERRRRIDEDLSYNGQDDCPDEELYNADCSLLTNFLPDGEYKKYFRSACSVHQLCYICMDVYGTTASECDSGFLEESYRICQENRPCQTATKTMVLSNRRKHQDVGGEIDNCELQLCLRNKLDVKRSTEK